MKTYVEINGAVYEVVPQRFDAEVWKSSCEQCAAAIFCDEAVEGCTVYPEWDCREYDTDTYNVHLERLAKPLIGLNTPSEARRRAVV